jgi:hypothetical protein
VLTQQQHEPITESVQENNKCTKICLCIIYYLQNNNILIGQIIVHTHIETSAATTTTTTTN